MNAIDLIAPWMARHRPRPMTGDSLKAFAKSVAEMATLCDVFPPAPGTWTHDFNPVEHAYVLVAGAPYCKASVFRPRRPAEKSESFGAFDERAPDDFVIFADRRKIRTRFSPPIRLAIWLDAVRCAFPDLGEADRGFVAAHLCRAHIKASYHAPQPWARTARIVFGWRGDYSVSALDLRRSDVCIPHHFLWEEALDDIMRFARKEAVEYFAGFAPRSETDEEFVDGMQALARCIEEQHLVSAAYVRENPFLVEIATSFAGDEIGHLPTVEEDDEEDFGSLVFEVEEDDEEEGDPLLT